MNKFDFGQYDSTKTITKPFPDSSYVDPTNEQETRKMLSYPLDELKSFVNDTVTIKNINGQEKAVQLKVADDLTLKYSTDGSNYYDMASSGHIIFDKDGNQMTQRTMMKFANSVVTDDGTYTIVQGIKGDKGDTGNTGAQGPQGPKGDTGIQGPKGDTGNTGPQGIQGVTGPQGPAGATGPQGAQGPSGQNGAQGIQGPQGPQGPSGNDFTIRGRFNTKAELTTLYPEGSAHSERVGWAYFIGTTGQSNPIFLWNNDTYEWENVGYLQGPKGDTGATGPQGAQGIQGPQGPQGVQGDTGPQGIQGPQGETGPQGPKGDDGVGVPTGGTIGQALVKKSSTNYDVEWAKVEGLPIGGTQGQMLVKNSSTDGDASWNTMKTINSNSLVGNGNIAVQETLVSGTNIKTINSNSILGSGNVDITSVYFKDTASGSAEIKTMTLDDAGTQIIYPRTKQTAISDANGNTMGDVGFYGANTIASGISVPSLSVPRFIDFSNVIRSGATKTASISYTTSIDCFLYINSDAESVTIDGITLYDSSNVERQLNMLVKSGTIITTSGTTTGHGTNLWIFGLKE